MSNFEQAGLPEDRKGQGTRSGRFFPESRKLPHADVSARARFHPEMVFFANPGVNLRGCLCGVLQYASAQPLD
ncbi:MAG: hypothetical protein ACQET7_08460, partial [Thermodesulfobacteriota bacterium]